MERGGDMRDTRMQANVIFEEITIGQETVWSCMLSRNDLGVFALATGDLDPFYVDGSDPGGTVEAESVEAAGAGVAVLTMLGRQMPGLGTKIEEQCLRFSGSLCVGDTLTTTLRVLEKRDEGGRVVFACRCVNQTGRELLSGTVVVAAPRERLTFSETPPPELHIRHSDSFVELFKACKVCETVRCAVVHPCDADSLMGPVMAANRGIIDPVLIGPEEKIRSVAAAAGIDITPYRLIAVPHSHAAADKGVEMARAGEVQALMKGSLHTDELLAAVLSSATGLRTARRISHIFVMDVPSYPRLLLITDAAVNIVPDLGAKADIVQNAIDLACCLGITVPKVAILSAVETVRPNMPSTIEAAALCKMADRGQITGGILDGPLAFDNAISFQAARSKAIESPVAGQPDILLVPDLEAGNMLAKQLSYLAGAEGAGIVLGARVPIVLTSRADSARTRLASAAVMALVAQAQRQGTFGIR